MILTWTIDGTEHQLHSPSSFSRRDGWVSLNPDECNRLPVAQFYMVGVSTNMSGNPSNVTLNFPRTFLSDRLREPGVVNFDVITARDIVILGSQRSESSLYKLKGMRDILHMILDHLDQDQ